MKNSSTINNILLIKNSANEEQSLIAASCENYYINKSKSKGLYKKKCPYCNMKVFQVNELLHFENISSLFDYLTFIFTYKFILVCYNKTIAEKNKALIRDYYCNSANFTEKKWLWFSQPKTICKGCLLLIINKGNCIETLKEILKDKNSLEDKQGNLYPSSFSISSSKDKIEAQPKLITKTVILEAFDLPQIKAEKRKEMTILKNKMESPSIIDYSNELEELRARYVPQSIIEKII